MPRESYNRLTLALDRGRTARWCYEEAAHIERLGKEVRRTGRTPTTADFLALLESHHELLYRVAGSLGMADALEPPRSWWARLRVRVARWVAG